MSAYSSVVLADSPKAYFRMQEASGLIQDSSGLGHHATSSVGTALYQRASPITTDPSDYSIAMIADSFSIPDHADLTFGDTLTVEAWIHTDDLLDRAITGRGTGALTFYIDGTTDKLSAAKADVAVIVQSTITLSIGEWYHVVYTKSGATSKMYINGVDRTGTVTNQTLASPAVPLIVGADYNGTGIQWNGNLDEVAFYNYALTPVQVLSHYRTGIGSYAAQVLADSPAAYYRMDEASGQPQDSSGNGNHTTVTGGTPTYGQTGGITTDPTDGAILLDGTTEYFSAPDHATLDTGDTFSLEAWINRSGGFATSHTVVDKGTTGGTPSYRMFLDDGTGQFGVEKSGGGTICKSTSLIDQTATWYHLVFTKATTTSHLYLNGVDVTGTVTNQTIGNTTDALFIGVEGNGLSNYLDTLIDEVAVYPTALTSSQVLSHYYAGISNYSAEVLIDEPVAYYRMNEPSGQPQDSSGNANHTTVTGGTPTYGVAGPILSDPTNTAITFDGVNENFTAPDHATLDFADVFTYEAWIKRTAADPSEFSIVEKGTNAGSLELNNNNLMLGSAGIAVIVESNVSISDTLWHHVVATKNGATCKLYIDGVDRTGTVTNTTCVSTATALTIASGGGNFFIGSIDEVAVYPTALTAARVLAHYQAALAEAQYATTFMAAIGW